jgi:chorismate mutase / prephenate dehydratase
MTLAELRTKIDALDEQVIRLLNERADLVHDVGLVKKAEGGEIYAPEREEQVLRSLAAKARSMHSRLPERAIRAIYREIMSASFALEKGLVIAYFGPAGTNANQAARGRFGASVEYSSQMTVSDVFDAVARRNADYGVVPIEDAMESAVGHTLDVFTGSDLRICAEIVLRVEIHLVSRSPEAEIIRVYAPPAVLVHTGRWLRQHLPAAQLVEVSSSPRAAECAAHEPGSAALTNPLAAELFALPVVASKIHDNPAATARFLVIGRRMSPRTGDDRTTLMFGLKDQPGALVNAIAPFERLGVNIRKIESRPSKLRPNVDIFYLDIDGHAEDAQVAKALVELESHCSVFKVLGTYPRSAPI